MAACRSRAIMTLVLSLIDLVFVSYAHISFTQSIKADDYSIGMHGFFFAASDFDVWG